MGNKLSRFTTCYPFNMLLKPVRITMIGFEGVGKSTLLRHIQSTPGTVQKELPCNGLTIEHLDLGQKAQVQSFTVGGARQTRFIEQRYIQKYNDAAVYMFDGTGRETFIENVEEMSRMLRGEKALDGKPILLLVNKSDLKNFSVSAADVRNRIDRNIRNRDGSILYPAIGTERLWNVFAVSAETGEGIHKAFEWFVEAINEHQSVPRPRRLKAADMEERRRSWGG